MAQPAYSSAKSLKQAYKILILWCTIRPDQLLYNAKAPSIQYRQVSWLIPDLIAFPHQ